MSAVEDRLAAIIAAHRLQGGLDCYRCTCGATTAKGLGARAWRERHLAAVIASADDLAVIELPKPDDDAEYGKVWRYDDVLGTVQVRPDGSIESRGDYEYEHTADEMRAAAGVAAAAARAAEGVARDGE